MVRIGILHSSNLYGEALSRVLACDEGFSVVQFPQSAGVLPDIERKELNVLLFDASAPDGVSFLRQIAAYSPGVRVIALGIEDSEKDVISWVEAGARAFVTNANSVEELKMVIRATANGELLCRPAIAAALAERISLQATRLPTPDADSLTGREVQVAMLLNEGMTNKEIALTLGVGIQTVKSHVHNMLGKLRLRRRGEIAAKLRRENRFWTRTG